MSMSLSRRSSSAAHPTRQQLDELDALLKRMLDLPVQRPDDEADGDPPAASAPEPMRGPHRPAFAAKQAEEPPVNYITADEDEADLKPRVVADAPQAAAPPALKPQSDQPEDWVPLSATWQPSARTWKPLSDAWKQAQASSGRPAEPPPVVDEPSLADEPEPQVNPGTPLAPRAASDSRSESPTVSAPPEEAPWMKLPPLTVTPRWTTWPLIAFNKGFDLCLAPWGAPGRWLRGRSGGMLLGVVGVVCLVAAVALAVADWFGWTW